MLSLLLAAIFFDGIHVFISGTSLRGRIVGRIGERPYQGLFSLLSLAAIIWLSVAYGRAEFVALWSPGTELRPVALGLTLIAFLFVGIGLTTPNPTATGGESQLDEEDPVKGVLRITRHPFLWGVAIWALAHLLVKGDVAALILFGTFLLLALVGPRLIDAKRAERFGERWDRFAAISSNVPFAAIVSRRNRLVLGEIGWWRVSVSLGLFLIVLYSHAWLFGASPFPV